MCALTRKHVRLNQARNGIKTRRGVRGQINRHIIQRGIRNCRTFIRCGNSVHLARGRQIPMELHATKGWRYVAAWG